MLETLKYATISSIYVKDLYYYDEQKVDERIHFCRKNGITFIPAANRNQVYRLTDSGFVLQELTPLMTCNPYDRLFEEATLEKFQAGNHDEVLFVTENDRIKGVVHIVDYNHEFIQFEFFKLISTFERMLRRFLELKGETNDSLLDWMKHRSESASKALTRKHWAGQFNYHNPNDPKLRYKMLQKRKDCGPFQTFLLSDLLEFVSYKELLPRSVKRHLDDIKWLRNWVAHNKDVAIKRGGSDSQERIESPLYLIGDLKRFVKGINGFFDVYEELEEGLRGD